MSRRHDPANLTHAGGASGERRTTVRYPTPSTSVLIGWREGDGHRTTSGTLIDISLGGCAAQVTDFPPREGTVWFRLTGSDSLPWIQAEVIATIKKGSLGWTRRLVRLRFIESCPYDVFKLAVEGFGREVRLPDFEAEGYSIRDWR
jgi:hypothetical protein